MKDCTYGEADDSYNYLPGIFSLYNRRVEEAGEFEEEEATEK